MQGTVIQNETFLDRMIRIFGRIYRIFRTETDWQLLNLVHLEKKIVSILFQSFLS